MFYDFVFFLDLIFKQLNLQDNGKANRITDSIIVLRKILIHKRPLS